MYREYISAGAHIQDTPPLFKVYPVFRIVYLSQCKPALCKKATSALTVRDLHSIYKKNNRATYAAKPTI